MSVQPPSQFLIINDRVFTSSSVYSVSSYSALKLSSTIAQSQNNGNLSLFCIDNNPTVKKDFEFRVQNSGSFDQATYIWQEQNSNQWFGEHDRRYFQVSDNADITDSAYNATGVYFTKENRVFLYYGKSENRIGIRYANLKSSGEVGSWASATFSFGSTTDGFLAEDLNNQSGILDVVELSNDKLLLIVKYQRDLYLYISTNGYEFSLYTPAILSRFAPSIAEVRDISNVKMATSGNYVRIIGVLEPQREEDGHRLFSLVSPDRGSTWVDSSFSKIAYQKEQSGDDRFSIDLCAFDNNGTFLLAVLGEESSTTSPTYETVTEEEPYGQTSTTQVQTGEETTTTLFENNYEVWIASSTNQFSKINRLRIQTLCGAQNIYLCNHSDYIYAIVQSISSRSDLVQDRSEEVPVMSVFGTGPTGETRTSLIFDCFEYQMYYISKLENPLNSTWIDLNGGMSISGFYGTQRLISTKGKLFSSTGMMHFFTGLRDKEKPLEYGYENGAKYTCIGNWATRPVKDINVGNFNGQISLSDYKINKHQPSERFFLPEWNTSLGSPAGGIWGAYESIFSQHKNITGATFGNWSSGNYQIESMSNAVTNDNYYFAFIDPSYYKDTLVSSLVGFTDHGTNVFRSEQLSPDRNWCFIPSFISNSLQGIVERSEPYMDHPHGSCIIWEGKFEQGTTNPITNDYMVVGISSYADVRGLSGIPFFKRVNCVVRHSETQVVLFDNIANAPLATITPDSGAVGISSLANNYWQFRWAWYPIREDNQVTQCILSCKRNGQDTWYSSGMISNVAHTITTSDLVSGNIVLNQMLYFGSLKSDAGMKSSWKRVGIHPNNDLGTFAYEQANLAPVTNMSNMDAMRGRLVSDNPDIFYSQDTGLKAVWGGASGHYNDRYLANMQYEYPPTNINAHQSPRVQYRTATGSVSSIINGEIVFQSKNEDMFYHDSISLINTNVRQAEVSYSLDGVSYGGSTSISMERINNGRIKSVNQNIFEINFNSNDLMNSEIMSSSGKKYYLRVDTPTVGTSQVFEIKSSFGKNIFLVNTDNMNITASGLTSALVGSTVSIFSDRGYTEYGSSLFGKYMKIKLNKANETAENHGYLGSIVVGQKYDFDVPLSWEYEDQEKANQQRYRTRSGIQWAYNQGPPERQIQLRMIGDVSTQDRREFREQIKSISGYGESDLVFITKPTGKDRDMIFHGISQDQTNLQNQGWYYDDTYQKWMPVGDLDITFIELT